MIPTFSKTQITVLPPNEKYPNCGWNKWIVNYKDDSIQYRKHLKNKIKPRSANLISFFHNITFLLHESYATNHSCSNSNKCHLQHEGKGKKMYSCHLWGKTFCFFHASYKRAKMKIAIKRRKEVMVLIISCIICLYSMQSVEPHQNLKKL